MGRQERDVVDLAATISPPQPLQHTTAGDEAERGVPRAAKLWGLLIIVALAISLATIGAHGVAFWLGGIAARILVGVALSLIWLFLCWCFRRGGKKQGGFATEVAGLLFWVGFFSQQILDYVNRGHS